MCLDDGHAIVAPGFASLQSHFGLARAIGDHQFRKGNPFVTACLLGKRSCRLPHSRLHRAASRFAKEDRAVVLWPYRLPASPACDVQPP